MSERNIKGPTRRRFLENAAVLAGGMPFMPRVVRDVGLFWAASRKPAANGLPANSASNYRSLSRDEAAFTETMVNVLCPADHLTPNGVTCGLATFIDRELAGDFRPRRDQFARATWEHESAETDAQLPDNQEQLFKAGIAAANRVCQERFGVRFDQLAAADAGGFLRDIAAGRVNDVHVPLASWLNELVDPLLTQICFAGPIYDGYNNRVFWKIFGHPGVARTSRL
jgi:gluconate 2-dehydrogenase gamma chain